MTNSSRIKILWMWLVLLSLLSCILLGVVVYSPDNMNVSPTDMRPIRNHVNFLFCEKVRVSSSGFVFNGYVANSPLQISKSREHFSQSTAIYVDGEAFNVIPFYFLPGSNISIDHCVKMRITLYVIKGRRDLKLWKQYRSCDGCYLYKIDLKPNSCSYKSFVSQNNFKLHISEEEEYYIVYSNENTDSVWINLFVRLNRTIYNTDMALSPCNNKLSCELELKAPEETAFIVVSGNDNLASVEKGQFTSKCVPRIWAYLLIHGILVLFLGIIGCVVIKKYCGRTDYDPERSPILTPGLPPTYSSVVVNPPKYEDAVTSDRLPSYAEVEACWTQNLTNIQTVKETKGPETNVVLNDTHYETNRLESYDTYENPVDYKLQHQTNAHCQT